MFYLFSFDLFFFIFFLETFDLPFEGVDFVLLSGAELVLGVEIVWVRERYC